MKKIVRFNGMRHKRDYVKMVLIFIPVIVGSVIGVASVMALISGKYAPGEVATVSGVSIIASLIGVWGGLNIANMVERRQFNELTNLLEESRAAYEEIKDEIGVLNAASARRIATELRKYKNEVFYNELAGAFDVAGQGALSEEMQRSAHSVAKSFEYIVVELCDIVGMHSSGIRDERVVAKCEDVLGEAEMLSRLEFSKDIKDLLPFFKGEACFYKGFSENKNKAQDFHKAANFYETFFETTLYKNKDSVFRYFRNSIAQCYSEMLLCVYEDYASSTNRENIDVSVGTCLTNAINNSVAALKGMSLYDKDEIELNGYIAAADGCDSEMYIKNAAILLECIYKLKSIKVLESTDCLKGDLLDASLKMLERATAVNKTHTFYSTLHSFSRVLDKRIQKRLGIDLFNEKGDSLDIKDYKKHAKGVVQNDLEKITSVLAALHAVRPTSLYYYDEMVIVLFYRYLDSEMSFDAVKDELLLYWNTGLKIGEEESVEHKWAKMIHKSMFG